MQLFGSYTSPFVRHCRIALAETGLDFTFVPTDYAQSAAQSPNKRVPFLQDGALFLTDSSSILQYVRVKAGEAWLPDQLQTEQYCMANTVLDTSINLFLLEKDGLTPAAVPYLARQADRVASGLEALNRSDLSFSDRPNDAQWRIACLLAWASLRNRFNYSAHENLVALMNRVAAIPSFKSTAPPVS